MGIDFNKVWEDEDSRVVEILGGVEPKHKRVVTDRVDLEFTIEEWAKLFNMAAGYVPARLSDGEPFLTKTVTVTFVRTSKT
jgi:DNA-directed RNA polymerase specialized sigma24 family protein